MGIRSFAVVAAVAATLMGLSGTGSAAEQADEPVFRYVVNIGSVDGCMDQKAYTPGTPITLYRCNRSASQVFGFFDDDTIRSAGSGNANCLDVSSYTPGAVVHLHPCHGGVSQQWVGLHERFIRNAGSGGQMCMDLTSYNNFTPVTLFSCNRAGSQWWGLFE